MDRALDVGIIGAGTAGGAAAVFLARAGHRVTVYERVPEPTAVGAGITLQPTGLHVLERLGLREEVVARGSRIARLVCRTPPRRDGSAGGTLIDLAYATVAPDWFGLGLHRGVLWDALHEALLREGVTMHTGVEVTSFARERGAWSMIDSHGHVHGAHDLVVVADGARSKLRDAAGTGKRVKPYPWGALWCVVPDPRDANDPHREIIYQVARGNRTFLGLLPTGLGPGVGGAPLVSVFWSLRADAVDGWRTRGLDAWKAEARALAPEAGPVLDRIGSIDQMLFAAYHDVVMDRWSTRSIVYLGDAAHATSPQLGQGCNLALWDAMVLADELAREPRDLARALDAYSRARRDHLAFYQFATRALTPFFQSDAPLLGDLRDLAMPLFGRIGLTHRMMTLSMLGVVDGFFGRLLPVTSGPMIGRR